ncbi:hypothetical protein FHU37_003756 [Allostreptomyces psammosilenae]|uniref:Uncharacterized protein n=1 Tax=Allostreptomyces psammosilenae TaxID=1892865 RepID=A0A852ZWN9_9ACTN|nr:hypothetical protein [Allostreptomyces psammosilenae]
MSLVWAVAAAPDSCLAARTIRPHNAAEPLEGPP